MRANITPLDQTITCDWTAIQTLTSARAKRQGFDRMERQFCLNNVFD